jgi:two-component system phosphate regulon response regulator PhoB
VNLVQAGYEVVTAETGNEAMSALRRSSPDLVVLDLMLPDRSGTDICREIRATEEWSRLPVVMLTARSEEVDRVVGFELGADDYVTKPFSVRELVLRVGALLRRSSSGEPVGERLTQGSISVDASRHRCQVGDQVVELTAKEFSLLHTLMSRPGHVFSRDRLLDLIWGEDINVTSRTIDTHMKRLREKLGASGDAIDTVRGVGYRFQD